MTKEEQLMITKYDLLFESRLTKVETNMENLMSAVNEIKTDLRWLLGLMLMFSGTMMGLMAKGFHWL